VAWECNPQVTQIKNQKGQFLLPFFLFISKSIMKKDFFIYKFKVLTFRKKSLNNKQNLNSLGLKFEEFFILKLFF